MIRYYCDGCGNEVTTSDRVVRQPRSNDEPMIEIITGRGSLWNAGCWCYSCILKSVLRAFDALGVKAKP